MRWPLAMALVALAACSPGKQQQKQAQPENSASPAKAPALSAPPKSRAEALLYMYTHSWPGHEAASGPYAPRDDCGALPGAEDFRLAMAKAVAVRNADALIKLTDPHVRLDFGNGHGADLLRKRLASPIYRLWDQLEAILPLGCEGGQAAGGKNFLTIPWYFSQGFAGRDSYRVAMVLGQDVPLLAKPDKNAEVLDKLSWDAVELASGETEDGNSPFEKVTTLDGKTGYIARDKLRGLLAYRLLANRTDQGWRITGLIAGD